MSPIKIDLTGKETRTVRLYLNVYRDGSAFIYRDESNAKAAASGVLPIPAAALPVDITYEVNG